MPVAADAFLVAHGARKSLAQRNAHVFHGVVAVDQPMAGDLVEHVVEEADAGVQLRLAGAVEVDAHTDARFGSVAADLGDAVGHRVGRWGGRYECGGSHREAWSAASICALSSALPTVRRRQLASNGCI